MSMPHRFTTLRIGKLSVTMDGHELVIQVRILRDSDNRYWVFDGALTASFAGLEEAMSQAEQPEPGATGISCQIHWRAPDAPFAPGEHACPTCGMPTRGAPRYPCQLCPACVLEATDGQNRPLRFANTHLSGGFTAWYADNAAPYESHECLVRGTRCHADEHHFGGIVLQPMTETQSGR